MSLLLFDKKSYLAKVRSVEPSNLVGLWQQNEPSGSVSYDRSGHGHDGAYTGVTLLQPGVPGMRMTSPLFDGSLDYNDIHSAGLANDNLLLNPGFETLDGGAPTWANWFDNLGDGAIANESGGDEYEGSDACKMTSGVSNSTWVNQTFVTVPGKKYRLRFWTMGDGTHQGVFDVYDVQNSAYIVSKEPTGVTGAAYEMVTYEFVAPGNSTFFRPWCSQSGGDVFYDACEVRSMDGFLGDEGTVLAWAKVSGVGVWTDSTERRVVTLGVDGTTNRITIARTTGNNEMQFLYEAGNVLEAQTTGSLSYLGFIPYAVTWSKSGNSVDYYIDGVASGIPDVPAGTWVGDLAATEVNIGSRNHGPVAPWSGNIGPVALWNKALTADQIAHLSKV